MKVIEIREEVKIQQEDKIIVLEKGDKIEIVRENRDWMETERAILDSSLATEEIESILETSGHQTFSFGGERKLLANYMAGVLEGSIG